MNLDEYKGEGPKMGKVKFILQPEGTQLSIDGKAADVSQPVELKYGTHKLTVTSEKYGTLTRKLVVGSAESEITINMGTEAKKDKEAEEKKSSTTTNSSSTGTNSSTTNSLNNKKSSSSAKQTVPQERLPRRRTVREAPEVLQRTVLLTVREVPQKRAQAQQVLRVHLRIITG